MSRVYISGGITGIPDYWKRFFMAEYVLMQMGFHKSEMINPARICSLLPKDYTHEEYMTIDLALLKTCDTIFMLKGWENSKGANMEHDFAKEAGYNILYEGSD